PSPSDPRSREGKPRPMEPLRVRRHAIGVDPREARTAGIGTTLPAPGRDGLCDAIADGQVAEGSMIGFVGAEVFLPLLPRKVTVGDPPGVRGPGCRVHEIPEEHSPLA